MKDLSKISYKFTYRCILTNKGKAEEDFNIHVDSVGIASALQLVEDILQHWYGFITKRVYQGEEMKSDRYWDIQLRDAEVVSKQQ